MAEEIINIATLTIDKTEANKSIVETKQAIFELQKANSELRKDITKNGDVTGEQTKKFVENEQALKKLNAEYKQQSAAINDLTLAELKENKALTQSAKSRDQAISQTKELKIIRGQLNAETVEGAQALELLNAKIDANDKFLKNSASSQEKAATISGNYRQALFGVDAALSQFGINGEQARNVVKGFGEGITGAAQGVTDFTAKAAQGTRAVLGFKTAQQAAAESQAATVAVTEAQAVATTSLAASQETAAVATNVSTLSLRGFTIALAATGIGLVVVAVIALFTAFKTFQPLIDKVEQGFASISATLGILKNAILAVATGAKSLGEAFSGLGGEMSKAAAEAAALTKAQQDLDDVMEQQEVSTLKSRAAINKLNVELKDRTKTEKERLVIAKQIEVSETQLYNTRKKLVDEEIRIAKGNLAVKAGLADSERAILDKGSFAIKEALEKRAGNVDKEVEALNNARKKSIALEDEATVNLEKTYNKRDKLSDDAAEKEKTRQDKAIAASEKALQKTIKNQETEIALQRAKNAQLKQTDMERLEFLNFITKEEIRLIEFKASKGLLTEKEAQLASLNIAKTQSTEILSLAQKTIDDEIAAQTKRVEEKKKLSEQDMLDEVANAAFSREAQIKRIEESKLLESEKALALAKIKKGYISNIDLIEKTYEQSKKDRAEIAKQDAKILADVATEMAILALQEQGATEAEIQKENLRSQHEQTLEALRLDLEAKKKAGEDESALKALKVLEDKKYAVATAKIDQQVNKQKRAETERTVRNGLNAANELFEGSKAVAVATALFNTYQGITAELSTKAVTPYEIGLKVANVAFVAASGFAAVKNILKTDKNGGGSGAASSGTSTTTPAASFENVARTQTVATVNAAPVQDIPATSQPVLILETLSEAQKNQIVKINSK